jgi:uncharacterized protein (DUF305 family)
MNVPLSLTLLRISHRLWLLGGLFALLFAGGCTLVDARAGSSRQALFDQQFIDMMVPHHQGAVEMALIAQGRAEHPEIQQMAKAIIGAQEQEITQMQQWRQAWFGSDQTPPMSQMPMFGAMPGHGHATMDMAADVEALRNASEPFDRAFIDAMIPHHQSAIDAALLARTQAEHAEIKELAEAIMAGQQQEIDQLRAWRELWYGSPTMPDMPGMSH